MRSAYIYCGRYLYIYICISVLSFAAAVILADETRETPRPCLPMISDVADRRHPLGIRSSTGLLAVHGIPAIGENPMEGSSQTSAVPASPGQDRHPHSPFSKRGILFHPNSLTLASESRNELALDARWLRTHPAIHAIIVGFCDPTGSENCTHELAEQRGTVVAQLLTKFNVRAEQIVGVKGWEKADPVCQAAIPSCQERNRRARIFVVVSGSVP
jgi:outer membrane protein OmpA-like peptidoglycan-associated protein